MVFCPAAPGNEWKWNLAIVWSSQFLAMAGFGLCMPFIPLLLRENLHIENDQIRGLCVSAYYLSGMVSLSIATTVWGMLADRFGRKIMLLRASYGAAFFYPLLALAPHFWVLVLIRTVCSFFSGTVNPAQTLLVSNTPAEKHGFVLGTLSTAIWSGNMVGYLLGGLVAHRWGYTAAFASCGVVYLVSGLLVQFGVRETFQRPEKSASKTKASLLKSRDLLTPGVIMMLVLFLMMGTARRIEQPFLAMLVEKVNGYNGAALFTGIVSASAALGGVISGVLFGRLCDRFSPGKLLMPVLLASSAATLFQALSSSVPMLIAARFFTYLAAGGLQPILQIMLTRITSPAKRGTFFGWSGSCNTAGGILCSFLSGPIAYYAGVRGVFCSAALLTFLMVPLVPAVLRRCAKEEFLQKNA